MSTMMNDSIDTAKDLMSSAKSGTEHAVESTRSTFFEGLRTVSGVVSILRSFGIGDALGLIGLERRRGPGSSLAAFGAGMAVGAGMGMLFAPKSGAETRRALFSGLMGVEKNVEASAKQALDQVETSAKQAADKVESSAKDLGGKVKDVAVKAEQKLEHAVGVAADHNDAKTGGSTGTSGGAGSATSNGNRIHS